MTSMPKKEKKPVEHKWAGPENTFGRFDETDSESVREIIRDELQNLLKKDRMTHDKLVQHLDGRNIQFGKTTGTKFGTETAQKIGFWNTTPVVQPTTGVGSATFVAGTGTNVNDDSTFDGYTIQQVVKALRNEGLLA